MQFFRHYWEALRTSYWFLPAVMTLLAILVALGVVRLDEAIGDKWLSEAGWIYTGGADGARHLLATVAGSMITVAGVVFSVSVVALSLASSQFGPRLLQNFMRDRGNQIVLGTFISTYVYCLLVLRTVRGLDGNEFVPHIAVTLGVVFALWSVGVLIYYIHHASVQMQAPVIIANVGRELRENIDEMFPEKLNGDDPREGDDKTAELRQRFDVATTAVTAADSGYIQDVDEQKILRLATELEVAIRLLHRPGHFVVEGGSLVDVAVPQVDDELAERLRATFLLGKQQTPTKDIEFAIRQLVEVAVRALSPGINDPFTAVGCIDYLGAALSDLAGRKLPPDYLADEEGTPRVLRDSLHFADVSDTAIRQIRQYGATSAAVLVRLLEMIAVVLPHVRRDADRDALLRQALFVKDAASSLPQEADRNDVDQRYERVVKMAHDG